MFGKSMSEATSLAFGACPLPIFEHKQIVLGHGSGGKLTAELIEKVFLPAFGNPVLNKLDDQAVVQFNGARLAFTTDSFVVTPIFFPGGDIGRLAVNGTVNDLAMSGDRKSTRLNSSHPSISYAVFCLKKKNKTNNNK